MKIPKITTLFLLVATGIVVIFDIVVLIAGGYEATISYQVFCSSWNIPFIPFACGTLMSHFFAPDFFSKKIPRLRYAIWITISAFFLFISIKFYPLHIHPFVVLLLGMINGCLWAQRKEI